MLHICSVLYHKGAAPVQLFKYNVKQFPIFNRPFLCTIPNCVSHDPLHRIQWILAHSYYICWLILKFIFQGFTWLFTEILCILQYMKSSKGINERSTARQCLLHPTLFLIFVNDIVNYIHHSKMFLLTSSNIQHIQ